MGLIVCYHMQMVSLTLNSHWDTTRLVHHDHAHDAVCTTGLESGLDAASIKKQAIALTSGLPARSNFEKTRCLGEHSIKSCS